MAKRGKSILSSSFVAQLRLKKEIITVIKYVEVKAVSAPMTTRTVKGNAREVEEKKNKLRNLWLLMLEIFLCVTTRNSHNLFIVCRSVMCLLICALCRYVCSGRIEWELHFYLFFTVGGREKGERAPPTTTSSTKRRRQRWWLRRRRRRRRTSIIFSWNDLQPPRRILQGARVSFLILSSCSHTHSVLLHWRPYTHASAIGVWLHTHSIK